MKIRTLTLHNWRSIKDLTTDFQDLMILIGQNNHDKSNILSALLFFFGQIGLDSLDFNCNSDELFVEVTFCNLDDSDKITFRKYITTEDTIRVRKSATKGNGAEYHGFTEVPSDDWLKEEKISDYTSREVAVTLPIASLLPDAGRITKEVFRQAQEKYIKEHRTELNLHYTLESGPFLGAKNVAKGIFGEIYYVPSVKKATDDFAIKGNSIFGELYSRVITQMSNTNDEFKAAKLKITSLMRILNKTKEDGSPNDLRPTELTMFEQSLQQELQAWNTTIDVEITPPNIEDVLRVGTSVWVNDGISTDISRKGQGLQRALIFALVKALASVSREEIPPERGTSGDSEPEEQQRSARQSSKSAYFILEEPELYLHPQAQREFYDSLVELSTMQNQVILCTHSSSFLNLEHYKSICIVRKGSLEEGTTAFQCSEELFDAEEDRTYFNMTYWINPDRSEIFFAKKVILVEGITEKTIIPYLAYNCGIFRHDYTIVECGSKSTIPSYILLLNKFTIPYVVVYDRDHQSYKGTDAINVADRDTAKIESLINSSVGSTVILENDIEEEIGITDTSHKHDPFYALNHVKAPTFVLPEPLNQKLRNVYS